MKAIKQKQLFESKLSIWLTCSSMLILVVTGILTFWIIAKPQTPARNFILENLRSYNNITHGIFILTLIILSATALCSALKLPKIEDIKSQICFSKRYLIKKGQAIGKNYFKLIKNPILAHFFDRLTPTKATFNGNNSSAWRSDIVEANGFDERMEYGGLDCELGYRLNNKGIKSSQVRNRTTVLHLYHTRPYKNKDAVAKNRLIRKSTLENKITATDFGIKNAKS